MPIITTINFPLLFNASSGALRITHKNRRRFSMLKSCSARQAQGVVDRPKRISVIPGIREMLQHVTVKAVRVYLPARTHDIDIQGRLAVRYTPGGILVFVFTGAAVGHVPSEEPDAVIPRLSCR